MTTRLISKDVAELFLARYGIEATPSDDATLVVYCAPTWAVRLYLACGGSLLLRAGETLAAAQAMNPALSAFGYCMDRSRTDVDFRHALEAAMNADILISFVQQQRGHLPSATLRGLEDVS